MGRKIPLPDANCRKWQHDWKLEEYPRFGGGLYRDKVCQKCEYRKPAIRSSSDQSNWSAFLSLVTFELLGD